MNRNIVSFFLLIMMAAAASCSSVKSSKKNSIVGDWNYTVTGTPQGDYAGVLSISQNEKVYAAKMVSSEGDLPFTSFAYDKDTKKATGNFDYSGTPITFSADLAGDELVGQMSAGGMGFPFKATRKK